ncbi:VapE domain-containing protein [Sphingomonas limnosediminicola]|uniref:VapE domain-containing protein n=1 Tax=Sphingomonas limnosediminicola TaxID=940133 RepID=UPI003CD094AF
MQTEERWNLHFGKDRWHDIVTDHARRGSFHPVVQYLDANVWDGIERLDCWLATYGEAEDCEYVQAVASLALIAAVRRVRQPGIKFDEMVVLESGQGTGKSSALAILAVHDEWFADDLPLDSDSKVVMERTAGRWIIELAELKGMRRSEVEQAKAMISRQVDKARPAYGRMTVEQPRQCVFFGTTNDSQYLRDMTGNRRFWPVRVGKFDLDALRRDRDQLWAEASHREAQGVSIRLPERLWSAAAEHQASRLLEDPFYEILAERLQAIEAGKLAISDVWDALGLGDKARRTADMGQRLANVMQSLGWTKSNSTLRIGGTPRRAWIKGSAEGGGDAVPEVPHAVLFPQETM